MQGRWIDLSKPRRFIGDLMHFARRIPSVPVQRRMALASVAAARAAHPDRPCWPAVFLKAYAHVSNEFPELRRAYLGLPWPHLYEYSTSIVSIAVERQYKGEAAVFFGRIREPASLSLQDIHTRIRRFAEAPLESIREFRKVLAFSWWPRPIRRARLWLGLNLSRKRLRHFGTFGLSVYSSLGAESLHPLSPLTTTLNYGVIEPDGSVLVRLIYDHRVFDGATAARTLDRLEAVLNGPILHELQDQDLRAKVAA